MPVRQWRRATINIIPPKPVPTSKVSDVWLYEQIHGMPKDWHQLPPHNQELLRAARAGYLNPKPEEEKDKKKEKERESTKTGPFVFKAPGSVIVSSVAGRSAAVSNGTGRSSKSKSGASVEKSQSGVKGAQDGKDKSRKRSSPLNEEDPQSSESNKRQALERVTKSVDDQGPSASDKPSRKDGLSDLDRAIAQAKAKAKANGEEVEVVVEYQFNVKDPVKARPVVRVIQKNKQKPKEQEAETVQEKLERRRKNMNNAKEGIAVDVWRPVPRPDEGPGLSYLAKRHKNTITLASKAAESHTTGPTVTRAKVRRVDAAGNPYEQTVTLQEGQAVEGEIISTTVVPAPSAPGEGPSAQPTPAKRRPPPPKRKAKGPGRGRKKGKLPLPASERPATEASAADGTAATGATDTNAAAVRCTPSPRNCQLNCTLIVGQDAPAQPRDGTNGQDTEMADTPAAHSDDEEGDDGDDDDGDEEGGDDEEDGTDAGTSHSVDQDREAAQDGPDQDGDQEMHDASSLEPIRPYSIEEPEESTDESSSEQEPLSKARSKTSNPLGLAPPHLNSPKLEGSPLKNVVSFSPTAQSPIMSPSLQTSSFSASIPMELDSAPDLLSQPVDQVRDNSPPQTGPDTALQVPIVEEAGEGHSDMPIDSDAGATAEKVSEDVVAPADAAPSTDPDVEPSAASTEKAEVEDQLMAEAEPAPLAAEAHGSAEASESGPVEEAKEPEPAPASAPDAPVPSPPASAAPLAAALAEEPASSEAKPDPPVTEPSPAPAAAAPSPPKDEEDDGPDLLAGLERELDRQDDLGGEEGNKPLTDGAKEPEKEERSEEKPEETPEEKPAEKSEEKPEEKPEEKLEEKPEEKPEERPEQRPEEKLEEKLEEKPEEKSAEQPEGKSEDA